MKILFSNSDNPTRQNIFAAGGIANVKKQIINKAALFKTYENPSQLPTNAL